jgi:hypothetical protein
MSMHDDAMMAREQTHATIIPAAAGSIFGLRLCGIRPESAAFRSAAPAEFWSSVHRARLTVSVRWLVCPASTVRAPGHLEVYLLVQPGEDLPPETLPEELRSLLLVGFPRHRFEPIASAQELHFALAPFGEWAWSLALRQESDRGSLAPGAVSVPGGRGVTQAFSPDEADPARALALLATARTASMLEWTLSPAESAPAGLSPALVSGWRGGASLAFDCRITWSGSADRAPVFMGTGLAHALGVRDGVWSEFGRTPAAAVLSAPPALREPNSPVLTVAHTALPSVLPSADSAVALVPALRSPLPFRLPNVDLPNDGGLLGHTIDGRPVRLSLLDRLRHVWVLGQTGTGKTTLLANRILEDLEEGHGVAVLDPHGELARSVLRLLPASRRSDLMFVDVADRDAEQPVLNLLECKDTFTAHTRVGQIVELIVSLWHHEMTGPMWEQAANNTLLPLAVLFEDPGTLADMPRMFLDIEFRKACLERSEVAERAPEAVRWWKDSWGKQSDFTKGERMDYFVSKFSQFFTDPVLRAILGRPRSTIDLRGIMDGGGVLLCNLGRGGVNPMSAALLSAVFMQAALNAALSRADLPPAKRRPFFVYCDEFQRIAGPSTGAMLSELRKFGVGLVLAHQFVDQLDDAIIAAMLGNVGTKVVFRVGALDARRLVGFQPAVTVSELIGMPNFAAFVELLVGGVPSAPFTLRCPPPPDGVAE